MPLPTSLITAGIKGVRQATKGPSGLEHIAAKIARKVKPPLIEQALSHPAATPYERSLQQGYEHDWLHGTTGDITEFKPELRGETTGAASAKKGFFFVRDPISPPQSMIDKSKAEHEEVKRLFSQHNIAVDENAWRRPFEGTGAETASGYAKIGGSRTYKEAMRKANAAEQRGDWAEYEKYLQVAEDAEIKNMQDAQRLVAEYGERRDEMTDAIQKAIYDRPLPQPEAEKLDEWYKSVMPSGWYNFYNKAQFDNLANQLVKKIGPEKAQDALDAMQRFQSTAAQRRLAEGSQEGANVMPVALRYSNPYVYDFKGSSYRDETYSDLVDKALRGGHDALILRNTYDPGGGPARLVDVGVVFEPGQIRSKFAEFDPTEVGNPDITKAEGGSVESPEGIPPIVSDLEAEYLRSFAQGGSSTDEPIDEFKDSKSSAADKIREALEYAWNQNRLGLLNPTPGLGLGLDMIAKKYDIKLPKDVEEIFGHKKAKFTPKFDAPLKSGGQVESRPCKDFDEQLGKLIDFHAKLGGLVENYRKGGAVHMKDGGDTPEDFQAPSFDDLSFIGEVSGEDSESVKKLRKLVQEGKIKTSLVPQARAAQKPLTQTEMKALPQSLAEEFAGWAGKKAEQLGTTLGEATEQLKETHPIRAAIGEFLLSDPLKSAGTALQDWSGTPREITEEYPYRRAPIYGGKTLQTFKVDPRALDVMGFGQLGAVGASKAGKAAERALETAYGIQKVERALPVGLSIQPAGKKTVAQLLEALETGEELTPDEMQRALYSKAQKEKYAAANIAKAQKTPAPEKELVKVPASEQGFYSSVEKALANTDREEGSGSAFINDIMKFSPSKGELEATGIIDWLKGQKTVTKQEVMDYLNGNKVQIEEVIRGKDILSPAERTKLNEIERAVSKGWYDIPQEDLDWFEATKQRLLDTPAARFDREGLMLPGGTNYKELLLKFPMKQNAPVSTEKSAATMLFENNMKEKYGGETFPSIYNRLTPDEIEKYDMYVREDINARKTESILQDKRNNFRTNHWPDDPNTFLHLRMQDMDIGGKKTLIIEEIQSDWHQKGRTEGYTDPSLKPKIDALTAKMSELAEQRDPVTNRIVDEREWHNLARQRDELIFKKKGVPDAPFKKDWYQLGMKRLLKYAADNDYDQIALVGPDEQIRRGSLGTYIDGLVFEKNQDGTIKLIGEKGQSVILDKTVKPEDLELYVGKNVAKNILESKDVEGTLTGDDLMIGGEGMRQYYDRNYPDTMNKLGKKYGTQAQSKKFKISEYGPDDVETVETGEVDRFGREMKAYEIKDPETGETIAYEYDFDKALEEANKKAPSTSMWFMDLPKAMKQDIKIGQPYKKGGAVKKRDGGPIVSDYDTIPDYNDGGALKLAAYEQELKNYA